MRTALDDSLRRSLGSIIGFIFKTKSDKIEFTFGDISGPPTTQSQDHYIGDGNKIANNMKSMLKYRVFSLAHSFCPQRMGCS